jgi:putative membrane protein
MPHWGGHWFGGILVVLFWVLFVAGIVALAKGLFSRGSGLNLAQESPLEILKRRYAKGEIDKAEFEEKKKDLLG